ncbi:hypothetical protein LB543_22110 [Mesorhizobium sp. ESP7-2]|uniref:hypothetical protein n=1 Tax=unclassified Mesorhizobium TaxID=325217 RepID=UPI001CCBEBC1|nr:MULTISPECIES: hypothetical protein [unclassified Mesorhizobium]MBZ9673082.1 hypothetical protein [Mesorhizobium sp. ES1-3]MBZ9709421.1 hypothetical protein [Mesorhizobium sp. ESP7-2]
MKGREITTTKINRRVLLVHSSAIAFASTVAETACTAEPPPSKIRALIEAHMTAYAAFGKAVHEMGASSRSYDRASREEERALLAICACPAASAGDRLAKARYLLEIEARGELDLPEHMQALLCSTISKA